MPISALKPETHTQHLKRGSEKYAGRPRSSTAARLQLQPAALQRASSACQNAAGKSEGAKTWPRLGLSLSRVLSGVLIRARNFAINQSGYNISVYSLARVATLTPNTVVSKFFSTLLNSVEF